MSRFVLCPLDIEEENFASVVEMATEFAKQTKSILRFLYVSPRPTSITNSSKTDWSKERNRLSKIRPTDDSVRYQHCYVHGLPAQEILDQSQDCDMIVMATHRQSRFIKWFFGSVAEFVMRRANCPVLTIHMNETKDFKEKS